MISIKQLTKKYGDQVIFEKTDCQMKQGLLCLLGESGCGKSTLLNLIAGFDCNYDGTIIVNGLTLRDLSSDELCDYRRDHIGFIFQDYHLLAGYTVLENMMVACEAYGNVADSEMQKADAILAKMNMLEKRNQKVENLSGGQKQRVAIARALMSYPSILLCDEPTGALDRQNSQDIMDMLKTISSDTLVIVITHDKKNCEYADEVLTIENGIILHDGRSDEIDDKLQTITPKVHSSSKISIRKRSIKNFCVHWKRYLSIATAISIGMASFILSLSIQNIMNASIEQFKDDNFVYKSGYIKADENINTAVEIISKDERINSFYKQYKLGDMKLSYEEKEVMFPEKYPMAMANESMSYGAMPKEHENQIALSPSLAKKFMSNIQDLINTEITLDFKDVTYKVMVSGIFNAEYDDFYLSSDMEQKLYSDTSNDAYSLSYQVKNFEDIVAIQNMLNEKGIKSISAADEVDAFMNTFHTVKKLFAIVSVLIFSICLFISTVLLVKLRNTRYKEVGLLFALGYKRKTIQAMIVSEKILLSVFAVVVNCVLIGCVMLISTATGMAVHITLQQFMLSMLMTFLTIILISLFVIHKLIHIEVVDALKK